jgi:hypothetical protein
MLSELKQLFCLLLYKISGYFYMNNEQAKYFTRKTTSCAPSLVRIGCSSHQKPQLIKTLDVLYVVVK